jgi:hypothetical protein
MKTFGLLSVAAVAALLFTACKKDNTPAAANATLQKLQARWIFDKDIYHQYVGGVHMRDTVVGTATDYIDFRTDNKAYYKFGITYDTANYALLGTDKLITWDATSRDTTNIGILNDHQFQIFSREVNGADYYEDTTFFVR